MKNTGILFFISVYSSLAFSQTLLNPVAHKLEDSRYSETSLSFDGYLQSNKNECTNRIASQMLKLKNEKNKDFQNSLQMIAAKLKQIDNRCNYFRFELIDYVENGLSDMRFAYRCYEKATETRPDIRVSHIDPYVINPSVFARYPDRMKEQCDAVAITKILKERPAKSTKKTAPETPPKPIKKAPQSPIKIKKSSSQN